MRLEFPGHRRHGRRGMSQDVPSRSAVGVGHRSHVVSGAVVEERRSRRRGSGRTGCHRRRRLGVAQVNDYCTVVVVTAFIVLHILITLSHTLLNCPKTTSREYKFSIYRHARIRNDSIILKYWRTVERHRANMTLRNMV